MLGKARDATVRPDLHQIAGRAGCTADEGAGMAKLTIIKYGDPLLREKSAPLESVTDGDRKLIEDMGQTMLEAPGVGLAAVQVGVPRRGLVIDPDAGTEHPQQRAMAFINPEIVETDGGKVAYEEGCLSIPGCEETVKRARLVKVRALDPAGSPFLFEATETQSRILQHEIDHLDGVLFVDRINPIKRDILRRKLRKRVAAGDFDDDSES
jgi:peptide deformylase